MVDEPLVKVVTAEVAITVGCEYLKDTITNIKDGDIEGTTTKVEDRNAGVLLFLEPIGQCGCGGLVDDAFDTKASDFAYFLSGLALGIVEVGRDYNHGFFDGFSEIVLGRLFEFAKDHGRDFRWCVVLVSNIHAHKIFPSTDHGVGDVLFFLLNFTMSAAHKPLDAEDGIFRIGDLLVPGGLAHEAVALIRETNYGRGCPIAGGVDDYGRAVALHDCDNRVCGAEVDSDDF
jgi:hypothetical protein